MNIGNFAKRAAGVASTWLHRTMPGKFDRFGILLYHRVAPCATGIAEPEFNVTPSNFRKQLTGLQARGFCFRSLGEMLTASGDGTWIPERSVVVTFDDGYANVFRHVWPVLRELEIPATIFVNTAYLDSDAPFPFDSWAIEHQACLDKEVFRPLRLAECKALLDSGLIEIGAHTHTHRDFRGQLEVFRDDLTTNVEFLRQGFGLCDVSFAFPYGRVSMGFAGGELSKVAREVGVTCALTTECERIGTGDDPFHWGRFNVYDWDTPATLQAKLGGNYSWAPKLQDRVAQRLGRRG